ncbi:GRAM domain-containing protein [Peptococcus simiae]|uniref:GRAM domain-containing protein n=1 Tax=Peptococcus simiae TaxID=1643805 RepID=A0ABW9H0E6_9FIRM
MSHEVDEGREAGERTLRKGFANRYTRVHNNKDSFLVGVADVLLSDAQKRETASGGFLELTDRKLYFRPHSVNFDISSYTIPLDTITNVYQSRNLLISQHIIVDTLDESHKFVVYRGKAWVAAIKAAAGLA